jgi:polyisoprenyl-teichoic acid--peptidoglycan teichoic acid transferase
MQYSNSKDQRQGDVGAIGGRKKQAMLNLILLIFVSLVSVLLFAGFFFGKYNNRHLITDFLFTPETKIKTFAGRTNILILGRSGTGFTAPDLTDTIIFASLSIEKPSLVMVSLPRDIWVPEIRAKLNSAYFWGKQKEEWGGMDLAKSLVGEIVGQPIHYGLVIDFSGFTKAIDVIGGIDVMVENSFTDEKYPIYGKENDLCDGDKEYKCRYETITFEKGKMHMDGTTALKYVRSRNSSGVEGTDLAREARQQKMLSAIKTKMLNPSVFLSPKKMFGIWKVFVNSVETDIDSSAVAILGRKFLEASSHIRSVVLSEDFLVNPKPTTEYDNQYVFIPKDGDWTKVNAWVSDLLTRN